MSRRNPSRARRTQQRAAARRALKQARRDLFGTKPAKRLAVPKHIQDLTDQPKETDHA